ncbi:MBOAT family O-acyltransferase [Cohaesibacter celericrescens]|uniref:Probable alginate O-acetylase AlgI n=1 Tax=Cohaesibacter celericrescens TaxID=2067669 RepID=A0A2N5XPW7_9HYPH|nr:MBOAT family O-acyltransferase [Cohaesibacter celericrescens]PLW76571.1 hypothetical protein C0081_13965 [Cohaesibacter celericrescens]
MLFNSFPFLIFFAAYLAVHIACPVRWRIWWLIIASAYFYGYWNWNYVWLPFVLIGSTFLMTSWVLNAEVKNRKAILGLGVVMALLPLLFFKYTNFIWSDVAGPLGNWMFGWQYNSELLSWSRPLGISFITFTLLAFLIDYYTGRYRAPLSLKWLLGYVLFFPHLISGPILRPHELIPQLQRGLHVRLKSILPGLALITVGLVKKMVFADQLGADVSYAYMPDTDRQWFDFLLAYYAFPVQIYCDLSGYTDIALGLARILGVHLPRNFMQPYCAPSFTEFWQRWHITLSHWFRDYVFLYLPGSRRNYGKALRNVVITMTLTGVWHGASMTFVVWGALNGLQMALERLIKRAWRKRKPVPRLLRQLFTFHLVALLLVLFRASDFSMAFGVLKGLFSPSSIAMVSGDLLANASVSHAFQISLIILFFLLHPWDDNRRVIAACRLLGTRLTMGLIIMGLVLSITVGINGTTQFIYFDF